MPPQKNQVTTSKGNTRVRPKYVKQHTLQYKTFLKRALAEALQNAFAEHPDKSLAKTKVGVEYGTDRTDFPQVIIKFYEKSINNVGVGHEEWGPSPTDPNYPKGPITEFIKYYHRLYHGDIEFEVWALSSLDRDKVVDALIETIAMADVSFEGTHFQERLYDSFGKTPFSEWHFLAINTDLISGYGDQQEQVPWLAEDQLGYKTAYRVPVMGEFYSLTPTPPVGTGLVEEVDIYMWDELDPKDIPPEDFPDGVIPEEDYIKIRKRHKVIPEGEESGHGLETSLTLETSPTLETDA